MNQDPGLWKGVVCLEVQGQVWFGWNPWGMEGMGGNPVSKVACSQNVKARLKNLLSVCLFLRGSEEPL